jgi:hypothetical protein
VKSLRLLWDPILWVARGVATFVLWTLWLGLAVLFVLQIYAASVKELEVPVFVLRAFEQRLAASGMHAAVGRTQFDPSGRVLMQDVKVTLPGFNEPLVTARAIYARLDPWALAFGRFEPLELRVTGADLRVPAMFSPSGRSDGVISDLDAVLAPDGDDLGISSLNFRLGNLRVSVHGTVHLRGLQSGRATRVPVGRFLVQNYGSLTRQLDGVIDELAALDKPLLQAELMPSVSHGAVVNATLLAAGLRTPGRIGIQANGLRLSSLFPLPIGEAEDVEIEAGADSLRAPSYGGSARGLRALLTCRFSAGGLIPAIKEVEIAAADADAGGVDLRSPIVSLAPGPLPRLHAEVRGRLAGAPMSARADLDFDASTAVVDFDGDLSPSLLDPVGRRVRRDLRRFLDMPSPVSVAGEARFGAGWKFQGVSGRAAVNGLVIRGVRIDEARARVEFDGRRLFAPEAFVRFGTSFARGSYDEDVSNLGYRFLIEGRLQPLAIAPWFQTKWWSEFFGHFQFPSEPPFANIDWRGRWPTDHESSIYLFVDSSAPVYNGAAFDDARARLFVRPNVVTDGLEIQASRGAGAASGTFRLAVAKRSLDVDIASTLDFGLAARALGPKGASLAAPFAFDRPPALEVRGHWDGPAASDVRATNPAWRIQSLRIDAKSGGGVRFHNFQLDGLAFSADVRGDDIALDPLAIGFAGGAATGRVRISGSGAARQIRLDTDLKGASLAGAIRAIQKYAALNSGKPQPSTDIFLKGKADVRLDLSVSAVGAYADPLSYQGRGTASLQGAGLYDVPMLGMLSRLLDFTTLRFNTARADFQLNGPVLVFPDVRLTGANSAIQARGTYALNRHALDFNARIYPLGQSKGFVQRFIDVPLSLLSDVFEVKLTGSLDKPSWTLLAGPTNLVRALTSQGNGAGKSPSSAPPTPLARPAPAPGQDSSGNGQSGGF